MKLEPPINANYAAVVVRIKALIDLPGLDNVRGAPLIGYQAIVGKDVQVGDVGVVFPPEVQLNVFYAAANNLHRHEFLNVDTTAKGYLEDNRRVKAIKFRGNRSDCLFMPLDSFAYAGVDTSELTEGMIFDKLGDEPICWKFVRKTKGSSFKLAHIEPKFDRVDPRSIPEHFDSANYFREQDKIPPLAWVYITQKLHGSSIRVANARVLRKLKLRERIALKWGVKVDEHEYDTIYGSRKVIKDAENPNQNHFYDEDIWTREGRRIKDVIPEGFVVYGELIGWVGESRDAAAIQKDYTYCIPQGQTCLYVYRIAHVNTQGRLTDLSWPQVKLACQEWGLNHVPELAYGVHQDCNMQFWLDKRFYDEGYVGALPLGPNKKLVDEGVCIRWDNGFVPTIQKAKSPIFLQGESKALDDETVVDIEAEEAA